jgi:hypothetical protein
MIYCSYSQYQEFGGQLAESTWQIWATRASRTIDRLTYGRAEAYAEKLNLELADACAQITDALYRCQQVTVRGLGLAAASNDGISETYLDGSAAVRSENTIARQILAGALGHDPYGLLYAGVM